MDLLLPQLAMSIERCPHSMGYTEAAKVVSYNQGAIIALHLSIYPSNGHNTWKGHLRSLRAAYEVLVAAFEASCVLMKMKIVRGDLLVLLCVHGIRGSGPFFMSQVSNNTHRRIDQRSWFKLKQEYDVLPQDGREECLRYRRHRDVLKSLIDWINNAQR